VWSKGVLYEKNHLKGYVLNVIYHTSSPLNLKTWRAPARPSLVLIRGGSDICAALTGIADLLIALSYSAFAYPSK
jgi:hypothetical protein